MRIYLYFSGLCETKEQEESFSLNPQGQAAHEAAEQLLPPLPPAQIAHPTPALPSVLSLSSGLLAFLSAYAEGCLNGAEWYEGIPIFLGLPTSNLALPIRMVLLPVVPFINVWLHHYHDNVHTLQGKTVYSISPSLGRILKKHPLDSVMIALTGLTSGLVIANTSQELFEGLPAPGLYTLATVLGLSEAIQYMLSDGTALITRIRKGFSYSNAPFDQALKTYNYLRRGFTSLIVWVIPWAGALLQTALAFSEVRELAIDMNPSSDEGYRQQVGNIIAGPLALIYGAMHAANYGYAAQRIIIERWWPQTVTQSAEQEEEQSSTQSMISISRLRTSLAAFCAVAQGFTLMTAAAESCEDITGRSPQLVGLTLIALLVGPLGAWLNFRVEGASLRGKEHHEVEKKVSFHISTRTSVHEVVSQVARVALLTFARTLMQGYLIPDIAARDTDGTGQPIRNRTTPPI